MATTKWILDPSHSEVSFKVKHMMISTVTGHFDEFEASIETEQEDFKNAEMRFSAKVDSINTKNSDRDAHLKSEDFFNAAAHPELSFTSTAFDGEKLTGKITLRGVTKEITLEVDYNGIVEDPYGQTKAGFEFTGSLNRKDFGLSWSAVTEAGNVVVSDKVKLIVNAQFIKQD
ncbi:YceI family protein [Mesonia mobilis]|uniref:YceI family protein n=1 Tax=Mesonia mobilis TaxID=369791 RepID=UPI0024BA7961|nr:YceI family protein [Mesonia mobilis]|tara:strand:- start:180 stop:698 length:519 start_codon:yes stop_codon:yes gene_type:complete